MRHFTSLPLSLLAPVLFGLAAFAHAAPRQPPPPKGRLIRTIDSRVTVFYQYRTKDGKYHKAASVSKTVAVKVVKPPGPRTKPHTP